MNIGSLSLGQTPRHRVIDFLASLRAEGFLVGIDETLDAFDLLCGGDLANRQLTQHTIRALACRDHDEWKRFETLFVRFWFPEQAPPDEDDIIALIDPRVGRRRRGGVGLASATTEPRNAAERAGILATGGGRQSTMTRADYRFLNDKRAMRVAEHLAEKLARLLKVKASRRTVVRTRGKQLEIRRTLRKNLSSGGLPINRLYRQKRKSPARLIMLHDISHSMSWHNPLLYRFVRGITRNVPSSEAFAFHTRLFRVTDIYRERSLERMRQRLEADNKLWLGGTCIAESIRQFVDGWAHNLVTRRSVVIILSDGFDTDRPEELGEILGRLRAQSGPVVWLNPMLGRERFRVQPAISDVLDPHLEHLLPAHSIDALRDAVVRISALVKR